MRRCALEDNLIALSACRGVAIAALIKHPPRCKKRMFKSAEDPKAASCAQAVNSAPNSSFSPLLISFSAKSK